MPKGNHPKKLLVEGDQDKRIIPWLIEARGVKWGESRNDCVVDIESRDGFENIVKPGEIDVELKVAGRKVVGIVADGNNDVAGKWASLRKCCETFFPDLPKLMPSDGLIHEDRGGLRFGVWLMPDNRAHGMMETFLTYLVPDASDDLLMHASVACDQARKLGAPFKDTHSDKAKIHTWLSWQDPPGRQLHNAVMERILDPESDRAARFFCWFCELFDLHSVP